MVLSKKEKSTQFHQLYGQTLIKPLLRGRDIQKYIPDFNDLYIIYVPWHFPLHDDESIQGASTAAEQKFKTKYPAVYSHLERFKSKLSSRNKAEINIRYEWYALQRFGSMYWQDFDKPKIIYPELTKFLNFTLDSNKHYYTNNKNFILTGIRLYYLVSFFNSKLWRFCFRDNFPELLGGTRELRKVFFEQIKVKQISEKDEKPYKDKVKKIIHLKGKKQDSKHLEAELDHLIFQLYGLTEDEINVVEKAVN